MKNKSNFLALTMIMIAVLSLLFTSCDKDGDGIDTDVIDEEKLVELVNNYRNSGAQCGDTAMPAVDPVNWNDKLEKAAANHSVDMNDNQFFSHTGSDGSDLRDRIEKVDYDWSLLTENVAQGYQNEEEVINGWMESEGHCMNIMNHEIKEMGMAKSGDYWTQVLAAPLKTVK